MCLETSVVRLTRVLTCRLHVCWKRWCCCWTTVAVRCCTGECVLVLIVGACMWCVVCFSSTQRQPVTRTRSAFQQLHKHNTQRLTEPSLSPFSPCSVCGTLINFSADVQQRTELLRLSTPAHLLDVLERVMGNECGTELEVRSSV